MAGQVADDREHPLEATDRRIRFAVSAIQDHAKQKRGNGKAHGRFTVQIDWKAGQVELVTLSDETTYK